ncbi:MAG: Secretion system C-terminal sorting domain, partial [Bacteroidota bacterium]
NFNAYFSDSLSISTSNPFNLIPQAQITKLVSDTQNWVELIDTFTYTGNPASYISIGNFKKYNQINKTIVLICNQGTYGLEVSYYYIDDVSLIDLNSNNTGLEEEEQNSGETLVVSPNPTTGHISLTGVVVAANSTIEVIDLLGKLCISIENKTAESMPEIDISKLPAGVYFVKLIDINGLNHRVKIVKQ